MKLIFVGNAPKVNSCTNHIHNDYEIIFCMSGSAISIIKDEPRSIDDSYITLLPPMVPHGIRNGNNYGDICIRMDSCPIINNKPMYLSGNTDIIKNLVSALYTIWIQKEENYKSICDGLLQVIYDLIVNLTEKKSKFDFVDQFKNILTVNLANPDFNIAKEASKMGMSADYMRQCFKTDVGMTPLEYLTKIRIEQAKRYLLYEKSYSVSEIAYLCGFSDPYYFSRCFKKHMKMSPKEYKHSV